jgi:ubiquinone/menaquinone biosynthesis C-methylase UbiE
MATGAGYVAGATVQLGATAVGVDFSAAQVELARSQYLDASFETCDGDSLPFADGHFDVVVTILVCPTSPTLTRLGKKLFGY